jgi:hypothetical protein
MRSLDPGLRRDDRLEDLQDCASRFSGDALLSAAT